MENYTFQKISSGRNDILNVKNDTPFDTPFDTPIHFQAQNAPPEGIQARHNTHQQKGHLTPRSNALSIQCPSGATQSP